MSTYFSTQEVARMCHASRVTVIRWIHEGKLKSAATPGGHNKIWIRDLVGFLQSMNMVIPEGLLQDETQGGGVKTLIVEDDPGVSGLLSQFMKTEFPLFETHCAMDGLKAGMMIENLKPNLILLDLKLPGTDGFEICKALREDTAFSHTKIIVITGVDDPEVKERILKLGADACLIKPVNFQELKKQIAAFHFESIAFRKWSGGLGAEAHR